MEHVLKWLSWIHRGASRGRKQTNKQTWCKASKRLECYMAAWNKKKEGRRVIRKQSGENGSYRLGVPLNVCLLTNTGLIWYSHFQLGYTELLTGLLTSFSTVMLNLTILHKAFMTDLFQYEGCVTVSSRDYDTWGDDNLVRI
jgi:hypothetical protein